MSDAAAVISREEIEADLADVRASNFCSLWPMGKQALQALLGVVSSSIVKFAINTVISAGDAYCGSSDVAPVTRKEVLTRFRKAGFTSLDDVADAVIERRGSFPPSRPWITTDMIFVYE